MDINLTTLFNDFYHTRFFVVLCLALFTLLFSLRLDNYMKCSYWLVFLPLWIWKVTALMGVIVGTISWCRMSRRRFERETFIQYKAMLISFSTNMFLFLFELIACDKLDASRSTPWSICFIPLYALSLISIGSCIWSIRYDRSYEIELFCSLNILQFVFISLRLDKTINWSWVLVLIPVWVLMCISFIVLIYLVILTIIMTRSNQQLVNHHNNSSSYRTSKQKWSHVLLYTLFVFGLVTFEIMLTNKLDYEMPPHVSSVHGSLLQSYHPSANSHFLSATYNLNSFSSLNSNNQPNKFFNPVTSSPSSSGNKRIYNVEEKHFPKNNMPSALPSASLYHPNAMQQPSQEYAQAAAPPSFFLVSLPLYVVFFALICMSFNNHSGNTLWFGMKIDFCEIFLAVCPACQTYGNIQLKLTKSDLFSSQYTFFRSNTTNENRSGDAERVIVRNPTQLLATGSHTAATVSFNTPLNTSPEPSGRLFSKKGPSLSHKAEGRSSMDSRSNQASVLTYNMLLNARNHPAQTAASSANLNANGSTTQPSTSHLDNIEDACNTADDDDDDDDTDNPSVSILHNHHHNQRQHNASSAGSKQVAAGSRDYKAEMEEEEEEEKEVKDEKQTGGESSDKYRQYSLRSFHSVFNSDRFSIKSCTVKPTTSLLHVVNGGDGAVCAQIPNVLSLEMPD